MALSPSPAKPAQGDFAVREARRTDGAAVAGLWKEMMDFHAARDPRFRFLGSAMREFEYHFQASLRSRDARIYVAETGGRVAGYVLGEMHSRKPLYPIGKYGFISDLCVTEVWRRRGIGRALVGSMLDWFRKRGATAVELFVASANPVSAEFWQSLGFEDFLRLQRLDLPD